MQPLNQTIGIIGNNLCAIYLAQACHALGLKVQFWSRARSPVLQALGKEYFSFEAQFEVFCQGSDLIMMTEATLADPNLACLEQYFPEHKQIDLWRKSQSKEMMVAFLKDLSIPYTATHRSNRRHILISVRDNHGALKSYDMTEITYMNGTLAKSRNQPDHPFFEKAHDYNQTIADAAQYEGVFAVEYELIDGALKVHQVFPHVHPSGVWTLHAASCCQFENHLRACMGLALGDTTSHKLNPITFERPQSAPNQGKSMRFSP